MSEKTRIQARTYCGNVSRSLLNSPVLLQGWVDTVRDHGHLLFAHIRDISGLVQVVFDPETDAATYALAQSLRSEFVVAIHGTVIARTPENVNPHIPNGDIEVAVTHLDLLSKAKTPPFMISEKDIVNASEADTDPIAENQDSTNSKQAAAGKVDEDIRLRYRYLDIRRPSIQKNLIARSKMARAMREVLYTHDFHEVETPVLTKSTPEGARDYLVPSRVHEGKFYALPQSPQLFKQLLMIGGMDRYFQIVKCFRDEDLRPNRQPEFTQLDMELSFVDEETIYKLIEELLESVFKVAGHTLTGPFPRITYDEAMESYGSDAPDLRPGMPLTEVTDLLPNSGYKIFNMIVEKGGCIKAICLKNQADVLSKNVLQNEFAMKTIQKMGGKGLTWMKYEDNEFQSNIVQFFTPEELGAIKDRLGIENGDVLFMVADTNRRTVNEVLGRFRVFIAERQGLLKSNVFAPCWVTDFPLFELKDGAIHSMHHPFTQPNGPLPEAGDSAGLLALKARAYDVVVNGQEGVGAFEFMTRRRNTRCLSYLDYLKMILNRSLAFFRRRSSMGRLHMAA